MNCECGFVLTGRDFELHRRHCIHTRAAQLHEEVKQLRLQVDEFAGKLHDCEAARELAAEKLIMAWKEAFAKHGFILHLGLSPEQNAAEWAAKVLEKDRLKCALEDAVSEFLKTADTTPSWGNTSAIWSEMHKRLHGAWMKSKYPEKRAASRPIESKVEYQKFSEMAQWKLGDWRLERADKDGRFCLYNVKDGHSPSFDDAGLQQLAELLRDTVVKLS